MTDVGDALRGRYKLTKMLGRGGMAYVYLALDMERQSHVAVKVIREDLALEPDFVRRFRREAEVLRELDHPNVVRFYSFETDGLVAFIVMDYVPGTTLQRHLAGIDGPVPIADATSILLQVGAALQYAHKRGYVHRDVKAANIMLRRDGTVLLSDFGLAKVAEAATTSTSSPPVGTVPYMSPEQIRNERVDSRSDIYALGVLLFEMVTGRRPFQGDRGVGERLSERVADEHLRLAMPNPASYNHEVSPLAAWVIGRALAKDRGERWSDVDSFVGAWEDALGLEQTTQSKGRSPSHGLRWDSDPIGGRALTPCPRCGEAVRTGWTVCPRCRQPLGMPAEGLPTSIIRASSSSVAKLARPRPVAQLAMAGAVLAVAASGILVASGMLPLGRAAALPQPTATEAQRSYTATADATPGLAPNATPGATLVALTRTATPAAASPPAPTATGLPASPTRAAMAPVRSPTGTPTAAATAAATPTATAAATATAALTATASATATATPTPSSTAPTPTLAATATAAATVPAVIGAPLVLLPPDGEVLGIGSVLSWEPAKELGADEYYLLRIVFPHEDATWYDISWLKQTAWTVPDYFGLQHSTTGWYTWTVAVARQTGIGGDGKPVGEIIGADSPSRRFYCPGAAQPTAASSTGSSPPSAPPTATLAPP